jgi:putative Mn2+ efflux pump MntP
MSLSTVLLIAGGVSADAFAVALGKGLALRRPAPRTALSLALAFGFAQALMFLLGWLLGSELETYVTAVDHWIAFALLLLVGGAMLHEARSSSDDEVPDPVTGGGVAVRSRVTPRELLVLAVATSIDALAVGISIALLDVDIFLAVVVIGLVTFLMSLAGFALGQRTGVRRGIAEVAGGLVLIGIGTRILLEHLGVL